MTAPVSVLMPVYNAERYVAEAVESILAQTFADFEFLIIDDGSTDGSLAILKRYAERDGRIRLISRPNTGIVGALNEGLERTQSEFVARMDADDVAMPERLERQVAYLRDHPDCVALGSRVLIVDPDGDPLCVWGNELTHEEIDSALLNLNRSSSFAHSAVMYRRHAVLEVGKYRDFGAAEDLDLFLRMAERGRLANHPEILLKYRHHLTSLCHDGHYDQLQRWLVRAVAEAYERRGLGADRAPVFDAAPRPQVTSAMTYLKWGWWALMTGHVATARKHARMRLRHAPFSSESWRLLYCALRGH